MAKIISVVNQKGGTGKSACAANLGVGLALMNKKVLVVDADPQSDVSAGFGFRDCDNSNETLTTLMEMVLNDEDIPEDCFIQHTEEGIDIICSNSEPTNRLIKTAATRPMNGANSNMQPSIAKPALASKATFDALYTP